MEDSKEAIRINKYLSDAGVCSRREADRQVEAGNVFIDGKPAQPGSRVTTGQKVTYCGREVEPVDKLILLAFYKPKGIVCTTDQKEPDNIIDYINFNSRIYPIGRLDKDSEGLILLTNHGALVNKILRGSNSHEKEYIVTVNKPLTIEFLRQMAGGVPILDTITKPCIVEALDKTTFRIILTQGLNRQIRRMCEYFNYRVLELKRIRIMNINLGRLNPGTYRNLADWELEELKSCLQDSPDLPSWMSEADTLESEQSSMEDSKLFGEHLDIEKISEKLDRKNAEVLSNKKKKINYKSKSGFTQNKKEAINSASRQQSERRNAGQVKWGRGGTDKIDWTKPVAEQDKKDKTEKKKQIKPEYKKSETNKKSGTNKKNIPVQENAGRKTYQSKEQRKISKKNDRTEYTKRAGWKRVRKT